LLRFTAADVLFVFAAQESAPVEIRFTDPVMQEHLIAALRARWSLITCRWFLCEASIRGTEEPLSSLVANGRFRLDDPQITSDLVGHQLPNLSVA
jgi:hypothetical protein